MSASSPVSSSLSITLSILSIADSTLSTRSSFPIPRRFYLPQFQLVSLYIQNPSANPRFFFLPKSSPFCFFLNRSCVVLFGHSFNSRNWVFVFFFRFLNIKSPTTFSRQFVWFSFDLGFLICVIWIDFWFLIGGF